MHEVLAEIDAQDVPELLVVNKLDQAAPEELLRLRHLLPGAYFVSARTGAGIEELRLAIAAHLPDPAVTIRVLLPFDQGALVSRVHSQGTVLSEEHTADGTLLVAKVPRSVAGLLTPYQERLAVAP